MVPLILAIEADPGGILVERGAGKHAHTDTALGANVPRY